MNKNQKNTNNNINPVEKELGLSIRTGNYINTKPGSN